MKNTNNHLARRQAKSVIAACTLAALILGWSPLAHAAKWTPLTNLAPSAYGSGTMMMLLSDGTVMAQGDPTNTWMRLTPSAKGSYAEGTWSPLASMGTERLFFASNILPNGKVFVLGGEYSGPQLEGNFT